MKKIYLSFSLVLIALASMVPFSLQAKKSTKSSQTFMFTRPLTDRLGATTFMWRHAVADESEKTIGASARITPMFEKSMPNGKTNVYFSINCKERLLIAGDTTAAADRRDIRAEWFGLPGSIQGYIQLQPEQEQYGALISYNHDLKKLTSWEFFDKSWVDISIPVIHVKNQLKVFVSDSTNLGLPIDNNIIKNSLNQATMQFARIASCQQDRTGLGKVQLSFGTTYANKNDFLFSYYTSLLIPTSHKNNPDFLFSPILGTNDHWSIAAGFQAELPLQPVDAPYFFSLFIDAEIDYLFHNHQLRTFDLIDKPWSRYMQVRKKNEATTIFATNVFTECVSVHPYGFFNLTTGFVMGCGNLRLELGYDLWAHPDECVHFREPCCDGTSPAICSYGLAGTGTNSASKSTISEQAANDTDKDGMPKFKKLNLSKLNKLSGSGRAAFTQAAHGAIGYYKEGMFIGFGGSWEQQSSNTALEQWGVFVTAGSNF